MITGIRGRSALLLAFLFLIPAGAFGLDDSAPRVRLSYDAVETIDIDGTRTIVFDLELVNVGDAPLSNVLVKALAPGGLPLESASLSSDVEPNELYFGDISPHESLYYSAVIISFDYQTQEADLAWGIEYLDSEGNTKLEYIQK